MKTKFTKVLILGEEFSSLRELNQLGMLVQCLSMSCVKALHIDASRTRQKVQKEITLNCDDTLLDKWEEYFNQWKVGEYKLSCSNF